jgi:hypothetical protein
VAREARTLLGVDATSVVRYGAATVSLSSLAGASTAPRRDRSAPRLWRAPPCWRRSCAPQVRLGPATTRVGTLSAPAISAGRTCTSRPGVPDGPARPPRRLPRASRAIGSEVAAFGIRSAAGVPIGVGGPLWGCPCVVSKHHDALRAGTDAAPCGHSGLTPALARRGVHHRRPGARHAAAGRRQAYLLAGRAPTGQPE